ncbi:SUKH-4 family immunity protein [Streptomyces sp. UC4497]
MYESVTADAAVERIVEWHLEGARQVVELMGSAGSGRTEILTRVDDERVEAVRVDATGLGARELVERVREDLSARSAGGERPLVLVAQGQQITRERTPGYPETALRLLDREVAQALGVLVVVEVDWCEPPRASRPRLEVAVPERGPDPARTAATSREWALQALALAQRLSVPVEVWRQLCLFLNHEELELPLDAAEIEVDSDGEVGFRESGRAQELRASVDRGLARRVHADMVRLLTGHVGETTPMGLYAHIALAGHAASTGRYGELFHELKARPDILARLSFNSLSEADRATRDLLPYAAADPAMRDRVPGWSRPSVARWADQLRRAGLHSYNFRTSASWLHLVAVAQGDAATAQAIAEAVPERPWTVRWAHWRPPGVVDARRLVPGSVDRLEAAPPGWAPHDRTAVVAVDKYGAFPRTWVFDVATGEVLASAWGTDIPECGRREPLWRDVSDGVGDPLRPWAAFDPAGSHLLIQDQLRIGDAVVVASAGGVFAVEGLGEATLSLGKKFGDDPGRHAPFPLHHAVVQEDGSPVVPLPGDVFGPEWVVRLPEALLPGDLRDEDARATLTSVGLPTLRAAEIDLALRPDAPLPVVGGRPQLYALGAFGGGVIALHGVTGRVYRLPEHDDWDTAEFADTAPPGDDWDPDWHSGRWNVDRDRPHVMAENLSTFVRLVTAWTVLRMHLPMAYTKGELLALRDEIDVTLGSISRHAATSWWTENLQEVV